jgi:TPR repeat protein
MRVSSGWRGLGLVIVAWIAMGCEGYAVRPRSHWQARSGVSERAEWCASDATACRAECEGGDASACNLLGVQLELGVAGARAPHDAAIVYTLGCQADYAPSCTNLGWLVLRGRGVPADPPLALVLFQRAYDGYARACTMGHGPSCVSAVEMLDLVTPRDDEERVTLVLLERGCALGETRACARIER